MTDTKHKLRLNYTIQSRVVRVFEHIEKQHVNGIGKDATFSEVSRGWFIAFEGSYEALFFDDTKPDFEEGDLVKITFAHV